MSVVVKYDKDVTKALGALPKLVDPNAEVADATGTATVMATGTATTDHGHSTGPAPADVAAASPTTRTTARRPGGPRGQGRRRAATPASYGAPGREHQEKARSGEAEPPKQRPVSPGQGTRSFGAGLGKRRAL